MNGTQSGIDGQHESQLAERVIAAVESGEARVLSRNVLCWSEGNSTVSSVPSMELRSLVPAGAREVALNLVEIGGRSEEELHFHVSHLVGIVCDGRGYLMRPDGDGVERIPIRKGDVVVIPRQEPTKMAFPVRILEALSFSKPVIVTTMCEMGRLVPDCGLVVDPADPRDLAREVVRLAEDPALHRKLSENCAAALERYDPVRSLETIEATLTAP